MDNKETYELIAEQTNVSYTIESIRKKLNTIISDSDKFRMRLKVQQKKTRYKQISEELRKRFDNIL